MAFAPITRIHETKSKGLKLLSLNPNRILHLAESLGVFGVEDLAMVGTLLK